MRVSSSPAIAHTEPDRPLIRGEVGCVRHTVDARLRVGHAEVEHRTRHTIEEQREILTVERECRVHHHDLADPGNAAQVSGCRIAQLRRAHHRGKRRPRELDPRAAGQPAYLFPQRRIPVIWPRAQPEPDAHVAVTAGLGPGSRVAVTAGLEPGSRVDESRQWPHPASRHAQRAPRTPRACPATARSPARRSPLAAARRRPDRTHRCARCRGRAGPSRAAPRMSRPAAGRSAGHRSHPGRSGPGTGVEHGPGALERLLGGLKHEHDAAPEPFARQGLGNAHTDRAVQIVTAQVGRARFQRDGVHVGAIGDGGPGGGALQHGHDTVPADAGRHLEPGRAKPLGHGGRRAALVAGQLRMAVNLAAQCHEVGVEVGICHAPQDRAHA